MDEKAMQYDGVQALTSLAMGRTMDAIERAIRSMAVMPEDPEHRPTEDGEECWEQELRYALADVEREISDMFWAVNVASPMPCESLTDWFASRYGKDEDLVYMVRAYEETWRPRMEEFMGDECGATEDIGWLFRGTTGDGRLDAILGVRKYERME